MFESIFYEAGAMPFQIKETALCLLVGLLYGFIISMVYLLSTPKRLRSNNFSLSLAILPAIVAVIILLVGGNVARAFSLAGVFTLVRFRSLPGDSKDITFVFFAMAVGLTIGMGYISMGGALTVMLGAVILLYSKLGQGTKQKEKTLKIMIPEDLNYKGVFDDIFEKFTLRRVLKKVRTKNLGTLYELTYYIVLKEENTEKEFIDELRTRNGNLNISINMREEKEQL